MFIKETVDEILKGKNRSLSWLAVEMGKTFDGLKLSLVKGSIKYNDIILMSEKLSVRPSVFFEYDKQYKTSETDKSFAAEGDSEYSNLKNELKGSKEMIAALKDQLKDKEKIISLLSK